MAIQYFRGLDTWNSNEATEAWEGGGGSVPAGRYKAEIVGVGVEAKITKQHRMVSLKMVEAYDAENKAAVGMEINDIFALEGDRNPQNYFKGLYKTVAPQSLAPQFMVIDPQTQAAKLAIDWLVGDPGQHGAFVNVTITKRERQVTNDKGQTETREFSEVQRGYELVEPSSFAKRILQQAGLNPAITEVPPTHPPQQHLLPQGLQQATKTNSNGAGAGAGMPNAAAASAGMPSGLTPQA